MCTSKKSSVLAGSYNSLRLFIATTIISKKLQSLATITEERVIFIYMYMYKDIDNITKNVTLLNSEGHQSITEEGDEDKLMHGRVSTVETNKGNL